MTYAVSEFPVKMNIEPTFAVTQRFEADLTFVITSILNGADGN